MASEYNFPLLPAYRRSKAKNVMDVCVCTFAVGIYRTALNIKGREWHEPLPGHSQLLPFPNNHVSVCTQQCWGWAGLQCLGFPLFKF